MYYDTWFKTNYFKLLLQDAALGRSPVAKIFGHCMGSVSIRHRDEFE